MPAAEQGRVFLAMALCGALCAGVYDALRLTMEAIGGGKLLCGAVDLLFGALCAAGMTATALLMMTDPFRWFEFAGILLGVAVYGLSIGTFVRYVYKRLKKLMKKSCASVEVVQK